MRTKTEIYDLISGAMYDAMHSEWDKLSAEEQAAYRLVMHGHDMCIVEKNPDALKDSGEKTA
jgi:hypothetical protein